MNFRPTLRSKFLAVAGLVLVDYVFLGLWSLAILAYLWGIAGMCVVMPASLIALFMPRSRKKIGAWILIGNLAAMALLITVVNLSPSVKIMMHI